MAISRKKIDGKHNHTIEFDNLDDETREQLIACIKEKGKISVSLRPAEVTDLSKLHASYSQMID